MPTVLYIYGWRFFFYSNEGKEPKHIHAEKGDMECKYWLMEEDRLFREAFSFQMTEKDKKKVETIIEHHFDLILNSWDDYFKTTND